MSPLDADAIVVGAGPAGSTAARELARAGYRVLILDRARFPRYKACGGGLQPKTVRLFDFSLDSVIESTTRRLWGTCRLQRPLVRATRDPLVYCVMRDRFDALLLQQARAAGAAVLEGERVLGVKEEADGVAVRTQGRILRARVLIGADGAVSMVRHVLFPELRLERVVAAQAEVAAGSGDLEVLRDSILLDLGTLPGGYAWAFPKDGHMSVGAGAPAPLGRQVRPYLGEFLTLLDREKLLRRPSVERLSFHLLPVIPGCHRLHSARTVLVGDAAGLVDPFSGEGLYHAVKSAQIAAAAVDWALTVGSGAGETPDLAGYTRAVTQTILPEIAAARALMQAHGIFPTLFHSWLRHSDRLWNAMTSTFAGEKSYQSWRGELGRASFAWPLADCCIEALFRRRLEHSPERQPV